MIIFIKVIISLTIGFILALISGFLIIPVLRRIKAEQNICDLINERHLLKQGTPTMGGFIFIFPPIFTILLLLIYHNITFSLNFLIIIFTFISYSIIGFIDDFLKIKLHNNDGLSIINKFTIQVMIAIIIFIIFLVAGNNTIINIFSYSINLKYFYGLLILFMISGSSNAVNITDGLDGLCAGLCFVSFITYGIIAFNSKYIIGNNEIGIFCFLLSGSLLGFLFFNFYPAKVFMGDLGSLTLGATLACIAIVLKQEISLIFIGIIYIIETISSLLQIMTIRLFNKKLFLKSPLHHHFEQLGFTETEIIKIFYLVGLIFGFIYLIIYLK